MHWRRFAVSSIPLDTLASFDAWLQVRWLEKEKLLEHHTKTGNFPSSLDLGAQRGGGKQSVITTSVKLGSWMEIWKFLAVAVAIVAWAVTMIVATRKPVITWHEGEF